VFCGSLYEEESWCCGIRGIIWYRPLGGQLSRSYDPSLRAVVAIPFSFHPRDISSPLGLEPVYFAQLAIASPNPPSSLPFMKYLAGAVVNTPVHLAGAQEFNRC